MTENPNPVPPSASAGTASTPPAIRASGLVKHYGSVRAVDGVSFDVRQGEIVGFLGPNGAGKSTTMKMLTGYLYPDSGEVEICGEPIDSSGPGARARIGYLPEHTPLYRGMRVDRYLSFVAEVRGMRGAVRRSALERVFDSCDLDGYTTRRIHTLSKGYRQRVGLAQALIADPEVLILDEPTSGLDPAEIVRIRDLVVSLARKKTILLSTHVLPEVEEVCRRAIIIAAGGIVADGSLLELSEGEGEALSLVIVPDEAGEQAALEALKAVDGVTQVEITGRGEAGRVRYLIAVEERFAVSESLSALAREKRWPLLELRHETVTLERIFLNRTRGLGKSGVAAKASATGGAA